MKKIRYLLWFALYCGVSSTFAQSVPDGWSSESEGGYTMMVPSDVPSDQAYLLIRAPQTSLGGESLENWAKSQGAALVKRFATPVGEAQISSNEYFYQYTQNVTVKDTPMIMLIFAVGTGSGRGQLLAVLSTPDEAMISRYTPTVVKLAVEMSAGSGTQTDTASGKTTSRNSGSRTTITSSFSENSQTTSTSTTNKQRNLPPSKPWRTAAGQGLADKEIEGIYYIWDQVYTVSGLQYEHEWVLLLKDGTAYRKLDIPPADLDVAVSRAQQSSDWTRWRKQGGKVQLQEDGDWKTYEGQSEAVKVKPASKGETLDGSYTAYDFANYGGFGGYASQNTIRFYANGRFKTNDVYQAGTGVVQSLNGSSSSAASFGRDGGEYALNGYTLELRYGDGSVERHLFFFEGDKDLVIDSELFQKDDD